MNEHDQICQAIRELGLSEVLRPLTTDEATRYYRAVQLQFGDRRDRWILGDLRAQGESRQFMDGRAFERLERLVPDPAAELLLFHTDVPRQQRGFLGAIVPIVAVIGESTGFEYCIVPPSLAWLVAEDHHGILIAIGDPVEARALAL